MIRKPLLLFPSLCLFLTLLISAALTDPSNCTAMTDASAILPYDASKFDPVPMPEKIPLFNVKDERSSKQVFIKMKRKMMPPVDYFRDGLQKSIKISNAEIEDNVHELQFIMKDFHVELQRKTNAAQKDTGEITSRIEIDIILIENNLPREIGNYSSIAFQEIENLSSGVATKDIQYVIDEALHNLFKKIFSDQYFVDSINNVK